MLSLLRGPDFAVNYDPFYGGIDNELFALVVILGVVWLMGWQLMRCLLDVSGEVPLSDRELMQDLDNTRQAARQALITTVLISGSSMVLLNAVIRMALRNSGAPVNLPVTHLLIYFGLGLILLSQTRLTVLRSGWVWERINLPANLPTHWIATTLLLLAGMAGAALLLPTQYSLGLLATLNYLLSLLVAIVQLIIYVIAYLVALFLSLFFPKMELPVAPAGAAPPTAAQRAAFGPNRHAAPYFGVCTVADLLDDLFDRAGLLDRTICAPQSDVDGCVAPIARLGVAGRLVAAIAPSVGRIERAAIKRDSGPSQFSIGPRSPIGALVGAGLTCAACRRASKSSFTIGRCCGAAKNAAWRGGRPRRRSSMRVNCVNVYPTSMQM